MKNVLNATRISLRPIFMSLAILFTAGVSLPNSFEKVVSASYPSNLIPNKHPYGISEKTYDVPKLPNKDKNGLSIVSVSAKRLPTREILIFGYHDDGSSIFLGTATPKQKVKTD